MHIAKYGSFPEVPKKITGAAAASKAAAESAGTAKNNLNAKRPHP